MEKKDVFTKDPVITGSKECVNPHFGLYFVLKGLYNKGIDVVLNKYFEERILKYQRRLLLKKRFFDRKIKSGDDCKYRRIEFGPRPKQSFYSYSEILFSYFIGLFCGTEYFHALNPLRWHFNLVNTRKKKTDNDFTFHNFSSGDRPLDLIKAASVKNEKFLGADKNVVHYFNDNPLNDLLPELSQLTNAYEFYKTGFGNVLDYDCTIITCAKDDSKPTYKTREDGLLGYQPGVGSINFIPTYIIGRNGNSSAKTRIHATVKDMLKHCSDHKIKIDWFRSDSAADTLKTVTELESHHGLSYVIRPFKKSNEFLRKLRFTHFTWKEIYLKDPAVDNTLYYVTDFYHSIYDKYYVRIIAYTHTKPVEGEELKDMMFLMTDKKHSVTNVDLINFYNSRGNDSENLIKWLKIDCKWDVLPCSKMEFNTTYMIISAIGFILFEYIKHLYARDDSNSFYPKCRMSKFTADFINVTGKYNNGNPIILNKIKGRQYLAA